MLTVDMSAPASEAVKYRKVLYNSDLHRLIRYREPRPELEKAWQYLLKNSNIRLSWEELRNMNRTAIELNDGSGFFGQLSAYHHLHCLVCDFYSKGESNQANSFEKFLRQVHYVDY